MNVKKFITACLASFVVMFLLAGLWHMVLLENFYSSQSEALARETSSIIFVGIGMLILAILMALVYPIGYKGGSAVREGFRFGVFIGLIWILPYSVLIHGIWNYPLTSVIVDSAWHIVEQGIGGIIIGVVYGKNPGEVS